MAIPKIEQILSAVESGEKIGFCLACGAKQEGVHPDARRVACESCGKPKVFGAEELLMMTFGPP
jgi:hypothetical protein